MRTMERNMMKVNRMDRRMESPPEPPTIIAAHCQSCGVEIEHGDTAAYDMWEGHYYCDKGCYTGDTTYVEVTTAEVENE
ncbi:hypothetical protein B0H94_11858 [Salsuginibacillus halophilus]|uniref:Uncharacterized protein n=1 Tax=Salsuginibacillus halophilus TaxID=517424 RepID=A0A2P8H680_9BACI|nr:hypothetical protein [Salsuginibacillus halophilus]PSL41745.1 hypothetical protein B0H94_11858 [Salsuginibacillus halophilus]